jgi:hypothetical protein
MIRIAATRVIFYLQIVFPNKLLTRPPIFTSMIGLITLLKQPSFSGSFVIAVRPELNKISHGRHTFILSSREIFLY